jgi:PAS domain-containing protein
LTRDEYKAAHEAAFAAHTALRGRCHLYAVAINPPAIDGEATDKRKRRLCRLISRFCQEFKRRRQAWIAITIWEYPADGRLHCHVLTWIDPDHRDVLNRLCDDADIRAEKWGRDIGYFTKERQPLGPPDYERRQKWSRTTGQPLRGKRLSLTHGLKAIITKHQAAQIAAPGRPPPLETVIEASGQIALMLGEVDNPIAAAEAKRRALGIRQEDLAERLGIARPTLANAAAGRYRLSDWAMARAAEFLREAA